MYPHSSFLSPQHSYFMLFIFNWINCTRFLCIPTPVAPEEKPLRLTIFHVALLSGYAGVDALGPKKR
ncbi:cdf-like metal transporter [Moniliophthora roreri]|nr:cdf-like metal transporter [Moniliophthora roreri]